MKKLIAVAVVTCLAMAGTAQAYSWNATTTWTGAVSNDWLTAANWDNSRPGGWYSGDPARLPDPNYWWSTGDGYITTGDTPTLGDDGPFGNGPGLEIFQDGGTVTRTGGLNLQMCRWRQSGGSLIITGTYTIGVGHYPHGGGPSTTIGVHHLMTGGTLSVNALTVGSDPDAPTRVDVGGTAVATVEDGLQIGIGASAGAVVNVYGGGTLDVDLDEDSTGITVKADGALMVGYQGKVVTGSLTIEAGGMVFVASNSIIVIGDERAAMQAYVDAFNLIGEVLPELNAEGNTVITPEPATMCLLAIGGLGVLVRRRRR